MAVGLTRTGHMGSSEESPVVLLTRPVAGRISGIHLVVDGALARRIQV